MSFQQEPHTLEKSAIELSKKVRSGSEERVPVFKNFRKEEEDRLRAWHDAGGGGRETGRQRSDMVDIMFRELFGSIVKECAEKPLAGRLAVVAFGGYGRRELSPRRATSLAGSTSTVQAGKRPVWARPGRRPCERPPTVVTRNARQGLPDGGRSRCTTRSGPASERGEGRRPGG